MAICSHPGVQKNARQWHFIQAERSSYGSCRSHRALVASSLPSCVVPFFFHPRFATPAFRLGVIGSLRPSVFYLFLRRYGRRSGQPSSSSLARRACVHFDFVRVRVFIGYMAIDALKFASTPGPFGGRGDTPRWGLMAGAAACCAQFFRCSPFSFPVQPQSTELPATTEGRWRRRHLSPGHKAGLLTVLLTCTGCAFQVTPGLEKGVTL